MNERREGAKLVELLHLALLQVMPSHLPVSDYAVKGGANLRLFYGSRLRSQDIDFDYLGSRFEAVVAGLHAALASRAFRALLRVAGVKMSEPTKPIKTDTTRCWKLRVEGPDARLNTKIEFSAREADPEHAFETARDDLGREIGLRVVKAEHYLPPAAIRQKIRALAQRHESEPRDVFDLDLLLATHGGQIRPGEVDQVTLKTVSYTHLTLPTKRIV